MGDINPTLNHSPAHAQPVRLTLDGANFLAPDADGGIPVHLMNPAAVNSVATAIRDGDNAGLTASLTSNRELRVAVTPAPPPTGSTAIQRAGMITTATSSFTTITNATAVPAGYAFTQNAQYTVPAGKTLKITHASLRRLTPNGNNSSGGLVGAILANGAIVALLSTVDVAYDTDTYAPELGPFAAGTVITIAVNRIGGDTHTGHMTWLGLES